MNIAVFVSGGGTNLQAIIDRINDGTLKNVKIKTVVSSRIDAYAIERAKRNFIPYTVINKNEYPDPAEYDRVFIDALSSYDIDLVVLAGYLSRLGGSFIRQYRNKIINIHPSLIPSFCGKGMYGIAPHKAVLDAGVMLTGATVHFVDETYDSGPVILQKAVRVYSDDSPEILQKRVMEEAEQLILPLAIKLICENRLKIDGKRVKIANERDLPYII